MEPFWEWFVTLMPMWLAPNVITVLGLLPQLVALGYIISTAPSANQSLSWQIHLSCALGVFIFQTLDAVDGKQARRTGAGSKCGDFVDHMADVLSIEAGVLSLCTAVQLGGGWLVFVACMSTCLNSFFHSWEYKHSSVWIHMAGASVTEGQFLMIAVHLFTAAFGDGLWLHPVYGIPFGVLFTASAIIIINVHACATKFWNVLGPKGNCDDKRDAWNDLLVFELGLVLIAVAYAFTSVQVRTNYAALLFVTWTLVGYRSCAEINLSRLTGQRSQIVNAVVIFIALYIGNQYVRFVPRGQDVVWTVWAVAVTSIGTSYGIMWEMARALGVPLWTVKKVVQKSSQKSSRKSKKRS